MVTAYRLSQIRCVRTAVSLIQDITYYGLGGYQREIEDVKEYIYKKNAKVKTLGRENILLGTKWVWYSLNLSNTSLSYLCHNINVEACQSVSLKSHLSQVSPKWLYYSHACIKVFAQTDKQTYFWCVQSNQITTLNICIKEEAAKFTHDKREEAALCSVLTLLARRCIAKTLKGEQTVQYCNITSDHQWALCRMLLHVVFESCLSHVCCRGG